MGLTPAPVEAFPLAWISLVPLWMLIENVTFREGILYAMAWGLGYHGLALFWITGIHPMTWLGVPWLGSIAIALFCWLFISFWGAILVAFWTMGVRFLTKRYLRLNKREFKYKTDKEIEIIKARGLRVLVGVALWCFLEALWSAGPLWWTSLSYTQSPHNLLILQLTQLSGPSTVTAVIVAVNGLIAEFILSYFPFRSLQKQKRNGTILLAIAFSLLVGSHALGWIMYGRSLNNEKPIQIGIIQGNIPNDIKLFETGLQRAMERYTRGYEQLADRGVDAVLTPEGALPIFSSRLSQTPFYKSVLNKGVPVWLGAYGEKPDKTQRLHYTNSILTLTETGKIFSRFDKIKLVPLGEYIPFEPVVGKIIDRLSPLNAHMVPGDSQQSFDTPFGKAIVGICYESAFSEHFRRQAARGGEFILTASNNAHYAKTMPAQHHAQDVLRAVESDRWAARATNTGYSGIVDPHGRTLWRSGINTYEIYAATIYRRATRTLYVRWGDWLMWILLGSSAIALTIESLK
ncbi:MAG: apolipoprotein N-acyltransferase [Cyanobacteriota bacterium]|nr:apolipoprotein N-acyltransferase [Cyanobacteriota bacterium]